MKALLRFFFSKWCHGQADKWVDDGVAFFEAGELDQAVKCYDEAILWMPQHVWAHTNLGLSLVDQYNLHFEEWETQRRHAHLTLALDTLAHAIDLGADRVAVWRASGHIQWRLGSYRSAATSFEKALSLLKDNAQQQEREEREELEAYLVDLEPLIERAEDIDRAMLVVRDHAAQGSVCQEALDALLVLEAQNDGQKVQFLWAQGVLYRRLADLEKAERSFLEVLELQETHLESHRELAQIYMENKSLQVALEHSMSAYRLSPRDPGLVCNVGVCHLALEDVEKATEFIVLAHGMDPNSDIINKALEALTPPT